MASKRERDDVMEDIRAKLRKTMAGKPVDTTTASYTDIKDSMPEDWTLQLQDEFEKEYWPVLCQKVQVAAATGTVYPPPEHVFEAFEQTSFDGVRVVILGQDPYHGPGQAHGLSFSVRPGVKIPPSLKNIFKELCREFDAPMPESGCLSHWASQGVLMLNTVLTVTAKKPNSHKSFGWQTFTDAVIKKISDDRKGVVFLLWGNNAKDKIGLIDREKHFVLTSVHPSPFSASFGFFGNNHFNATNQLLESQDLPPIKWIETDDEPTD